MNNLFQGDSDSLSHDVLKSKNRKEKMLYYHNLFKQYVTSVRSDCLSVDTAAKAPCLPHNEHAACILKRTYILAVLFRVHYFWFYYNFVLYADKYADNYAYMYASLISKNVVSDVMQEEIDTLDLRFISTLEHGTFGLLDKSPGPSHWLRDDQGYRVMFSYPPSPERFAYAESPLLVANYSFCASVAYSVSSTDVKLQWELLSSNGSVMSQAKSSDRGGRLSLTFPVGLGRLVIRAIPKAQETRVSSYANIATVTFSLGSCPAPSE